MADCHYGLEDRDSIPGQVITNTQKIVLYTTLLNTQHYKVRIKGKAKQSKEWSSSYSQGTNFTSVLPGL